MVEYKGVRFEPMGNTCTKPARPERIALYFDGRPHPDLVIHSHGLQLTAVSSAEQLKTEIENGAVEGIVADLGAVDEGLIALVRKVRERRPDMELIGCGDDISGLEQLSRDFDGFVFKAEDLLEFSDSVRLVLDRCCARRRRGAKKCKHTHVAVHKA